MDDWKNDEDSSGRMLLNYLNSRTGKMQVVDERT